MEKEEELKGQVDKSEKFEILKIQNEQKGGRKASKGAKKSTGKKPVAKKGKKGKKSDDEELDSDDSLNEFIVEDDVDLGYTKKKKGKK
jgi:hypothetical protein